MLFNTNFDEVVDHKLYNHCGCFRKRDSHWCHDSDHNVNLGSTVPISHTPHSSSDNSLSFGFL